MILTVVYDGLGFGSSYDMGPLTYAVGTNVSNLQVVIFDDVRQKFSIRTLVVYVRGIIPNYFGVHVTNDDWEVICHLTFCDLNGHFVIESFTNLENFALLGAISKNDSYCTCGNANPYNQYVVVGGSCYLEDRVKSLQFDAYCQSTFPSFCWSRADFVFR